MTKQVTVTRRSRGAAERVRQALAAGRRGGKARLETMTAKERSESARHAANTRWDNE